MSKYKVEFFQGIRRRFIIVEAEDKEGAKQAFYKLIDTCMIIDIEKISK